jgi:polyhydroxybutyrate depolymerase
MNGLKKVYHVTIFPLIFLLTCQCNNEKHKTISIKLNGLKRTAKIYLPHQPNQRKKPLIINLHGVSDNAWLQNYRCQMNHTAQKKGFILVYPKGSGFIMRNWNDWPNEIKFISVLIDSLVLNYFVDASRIYLVGFSQGGMLAYKFASIYPEKIRALAIVGSCIDSSYIINECKLSKTIPLIAFNSKLDMACRYNAFEYKGKKYNSVKSGIEMWAKACGFDIQPHSIINGKKFDKELWKDKFHNEIVLYTTHEGGHSWPGGKGLFSIPHFEPTQAINANDTIYKFFAKLKN